MDINQVKFGSFSIANHNVSKNNKETKQVEVNNANETAKQVSADDILNALAVAGLQNKAMVAKKEVNPSDYLSDERIAEIEAMMGKFDAGVQKTADIVAAEFPGMAEASKLALAAQVFAKE